jgi:uncharacterized delta-60 repeat protein
MKKYLLFLTILMVSISNAQNQADVAQNFGAYKGFNNSITAIDIQNDGKILIGGSFTVFNSVGENRIIRLNADGTKDLNFITGIGFDNSTITTLKIQNDNKIIVGGTYTSYKGIIENYIIRLNTDGSKDTTFNSGTGFNFYTSTIAIQTDGKILVGGNFTSYNGITENRIIRLNSDGSKDSSFNTGIGFNNGVSSMVIQNDSKIIVGGNFTSYKGITENFIIRLNSDGSKDTTFNSGTGFNSQTSTIAIQTDGKILIGGNFTSYKNITENRIIRLNADGSKDTTFNSGTGFNSGTLLNSGTGFIDGLTEIAYQNDGKILVGGTFTSYKGITENRIVRLNADGSKDTSFISGTGFNNGISALALQNDGKIIIGGSFTTYKEFNDMFIIRLNADGSKNINFNNGNGFSGKNVTSISLQSDGKILIGGTFFSYQGITKNGICRLNTNGSIDNSFISGTGFFKSFDIYTANEPSIFCMKVQTDGKILIGGSFNTYNGILQNNIIRLNTDGSVDSSFNIGIGFDSAVLSIVIQNDSKIIVGGNFTSYKGITENFIIRLNSDGSKDTTFNSGTGFNSQTSTIAIQTDGKILIGGNFTSYNGLTENRIIRLNSDGSKDTTFNSVTGFNFKTSTIAIQTDGKILVGGNFTSYSGITENFIIRLNSDGSKDTTFNSGTGFSLPTNTIAIQTDGKILIGGAFRFYNGVPENSIIRLNADGSKDLSFNTETGFNIINGNNHSSGRAVPDVRHIVIQNDGKIIIGGSFYTYKDTNESSLLIKLFGNSVLETEEFDTDSIKLYPNPTLNILNIKTDNNLINQPYTIIDGIGRVVLKGELNEVESTINVEHLSKGIYYLKVSGNSASKFIKE